MKRERRSEKRVDELFGGWGIAKNVGDIRKSLATGSSRLGKSVTPRAVGTDFATVFNKAGERAPMQQKKDMSLLADYVVGQLMSLDPSKFRRVMSEIIRTLARELTKVEGQTTAMPGMKTEAALSKGRVTESKLREAIRADLLTEKKRMLNEDVMAALKELILAFADSIRDGKVPETIGTPQARAVVNKSVAAAEKALKSSGLSVQTTDKLKDLTVALSSHALVADELGKEGVSVKLISGFTNTTLAAIKQLLTLKTKKAEEDKAKAAKSGEAGTKPEAGEQQGDKSGAATPGAPKPTGTGDSAGASPTQQAANQQKT